MRSLSLTTALGLLCLTPGSAAEGGHRSCRGAGYGPVYYAQPHYAPPMYYQPPYAPGYASVRPTTTVSVGADDNYFRPNTITVQPGTTVRFVNAGRHAHTVT